MKAYKTIRVETATHIGETSVTVFTQEEWIKGGWVTRYADLLGAKIKPVVRVKMWRG